MNYDEMVEEIKQRKKYILEIGYILKDIDYFDYYWKSMINKRQHDGFFETYEVINWIGNKFKPKNILEIGTRTGGSIISLLYNYGNYENMNAYCFDIWWEYPTFRHFPFTAIKYLLPENMKEKKLMEKIKRNTEKCNIPYDDITFIGGNSGKTIPEFFKNNKELELDYALVDGSHERKDALNDLNNVSRHMGKNGIMVFDDVGPDSHHLIDMWNIFKTKNKNDFSFYEHMAGKGVAWAIKN